jgi:hypothetical protein
MGEEAQGLFFISSTGKGEEHGISREEDTDF